MWRSNAVITITLVIVHYIISEILVLYKSASHIMTVIFTDCVPRKITQALFTTKDYGKRGFMLFL